MRALRAVSCCTVSKQDTRTKSEAQPYFLLCACLYPLCLRTASTSALSRQVSFTMARA